MTTTILITGANRGIGLELVRAYQEKSRFNIIACCRAPDAADDLKALAASSNGGITVQQLDVTNDASIRQLSASLKGQKIDVLINNAGIMGGTRQSALDMDFEAWSETFNVNTLAPLRMVQAFIENLKLSTDAKIMTVSSQMGALSWQKGGTHAYCSSKAAVNKLMQGLSIDLQPMGITVAVIHPGWVQTDMGGAAADITPKESAVGIVSVIEGLTPSDTGSFYKWNGEIHPW